VDDEPSAVALAVVDGRAQEAAADVACGSRCGDRSPARLRGRIAPALSGIESSQHPVASRSRWQACASRGG
jgi:hypothetical protein